MYAPVKKLDHEHAVFMLQFTNMIMKTTEDSKKFSKKVMEKKERRKKREAEKAHSGM